MRTFICRMPDKTPVYIVMTSEVETRLNGTCFRGRSYAKAGNFLRYGCYKDFMDDMEISVQLLRICWTAIQGEAEKKQFVLRKSFDLRDYVGWSTTTDLELFKPDELETFPLNKSVTARRVISRDNEAPLTKTITVAITFRKSDEAWYAYIATIYPGKDVGELKAVDGCTDISDRERRAFFDWNHPGEPVHF
ncbi:hypothetical protein HZC53_02935 [Candidatus Uhrbacteria bacterium]|nr:hypothetical protein [Candidatus Uhrbacteria bacterium]